MMEGSKQVASTDEAEEESGWTSYFEDFLAKQRGEQDQNSTTTFFHDDHDQSLCSPSLLSDAASCAPLKTENRNPVPINSPILEDGPKKMIHKAASFKKITRTREISHDDSLEDTASSPIDSPKVYSWKQMDINPRKREDNNGNESSSLGKGGGSNCSEIQREGHHEMIIEGNNNGYSELMKKRGLCLVPLSLLLNYLG
ncbi:hypothetical protein Vadar_001202 [Vaccinium darrowii]|uniref:Uncharacterized protein n=1 Tax=Vaccinium darrowii TaxID=229202 RepID=A0ACB7Z0U7_9ERIC|nr:hypothetical protein Vadar_001202 [Vaccinium darrowii]